MQILRIDYRGLLLGLVIGFVFWAVIAVGGCDCPLIANQIVTLPPAKTDAADKQQTAQQQKNNYDGLVLFVFSADNCPACKAAKSTLLRLIVDGYEIETFNASDGGVGAQAAKAAKVRAYPTFLFCVETAPDKYKALDRWESIDFLEQKIRAVFARAAKQVNQTQKNTTRRRGTTPRTYPPEIANPDTPEQPAPTPETDGSGSGNVHPLLDLITPHVDKNKDTDKDNADDTKRKIPPHPPVNTIPKDPATARLNEVFAALYAHSNVLSNQLAYYETDIVMFRRDLSRFREILQYQIVDCVWLIVFVVVVVHFAALAIIAILKSLCGEIKSWLPTIRQIETQRERR